MPDAGQRLPRASEPKSIWRTAVAFGVTVDLNEIVQCFNFCPFDTAHEQFAGIVLLAPRPAPQATEGVTILFVSLPSKQPYLLNDQEEEMSQMSYDGAGQYQPAANQFKYLSYPYLDIREKQQHHLVQGSGAGRLGVVYDRLRGKRPSPPRCDKRATLSPGHLNVIEIPGPLFQSDKRDRHRERERRDSVEQESSVKLGEGESREASIGADPKGTEDWSFSCPG
ncbi:hypothetical protein C8F04DRAFT_1187084 [Mycena alexandri]|uniref:Uncharacterized protein n=1 Tax=Mycena alexandri TaxID=1745969 RepID=A0AAD6SLL5_9AGAR|nr:hypothetical protein C8F04DRAFT_1187084 [Mycena alexandri]